MKTRDYYLSGYSHNAFGAHKAPQSIPHRAQERPSEKVSGAGILISHALAVPPLDDKMIEGLQEQGIKFVTKHISHDTLPKLLSGSFKIGTTASYKSSETAASGRLGDIREGRNRQVFSSPSGRYNFDIDGAKFINCGVSGFEHPIAREFTSNDYCSCVSSGAFSLDRANLFKKHDPDIDSYVVYDTEKLICAIQQCIKSKDVIGSYDIILKKVSYGPKDHHFIADGHIPHPEERARIQIWLKTVFSKPIFYSHEQEIRIVLLDRNAAGKIPAGALPIFIEDYRIADAIVAHGKF